MKKLISLLLAAAMLALCLPAAAMSLGTKGEAADTQPSVFTIGSAAGVAPGSDIQIPVTIEGPDYEAHSVRIEIFYDAEQLSVTGLTYGSVTNGKPSGAMALYNIKTPGYVSFCILCPNGPFSGTGELFTVNFHTSDEFSGLYDLDLRVPEFYNYPQGGTKTNLPHTDIDGYISSATAYSVDFVDWDGTLLKHQLVAEGGNATPPADPVRQGYTFTGWDGDYENVTEDRTITAQYEINYYTVTFIDNFDGEDVILDEQTVIYGGSAAAPEAPEHKGYTFVGWSRDITFVSANMLVYAMYELTTYTVRFYDWDGTLLSEQHVLPGEAAVPPADPVREGYTFTGWSDYSFYNVTKDIDVYAQYEVIKFRVTFYDWDHTTEISHMNVPYGQAAEAPQPPVHPGHTFVGWDKDFSAVYSDLDVYALYDTAIYTVTFVDWDGTVLKTEQVVHDQDATPPDVPVREGYTFIGWDRDYTHVTASITVTAQYEILTYTVRFFDMDGETQLSVQTVEYGSPAEAPEAPEHEGFVFIGWDKDFSSVTADMDVYAQYETAKFTVRFIDMDGETVIDSQTVEYGNDAVAPEAPEHEGYVFLGWDKEFTNITADLDVNARYEHLSFTVRFFDMDGETELSVQTVFYGEAAEAPEAPEHEGFVFIGWDKDFSSVTADMDVYAQYETAKFTVRFIDMDGETVIDSQTVEYGNDAVAPEAPEHEGFVFIGWDKEFTNITADLDVNARYEHLSFTVRFFDMDGETELSVQTVFYGEAAEAPEAPEHEGLVFIGWDKDFSSVTEDMDVYALYEDRPTTCTVTFVDPFGEIIDVQTVEYGSAAVAPEAPEMPLSRFLGWDTDFSCVTSDMTVTARYGLIGDVNFDGKVDTVDALLTLRAALDIESFSEEQNIVGDIDMNEDIDTVDALRVLRMALNIE